MDPFERFKKVAEANRKRLAHQKRNVLSDKTNTSHVSSKVIKPKAKLTWVSHTNTGVHNRYKQILSEFSINEDSPEILRRIYSFVLWFKFNNFSYIIYDQNGQIRRSFESKLLEAGDSSIKLANRPDLSRKKPNPTHSVIRVKKIGKFIYSAQLNTLKSNIKEVCLLSAADTRFALKPEDLLVLNDENSYTVGALRCYTRWYIYSENGIDASLL